MKISKNLRNVNYRDKKRGLKKWTFNKNLKVGDKVICINDNPQLVSIAKEEFLKRHFFELSIVDITDSYIKAKGHIYEKELTIDFDKYNGISQDASFLYLILKTK